MKPKIHYLNTDLDLHAPCNLEPLAKALEAAGAFVFCVEPFSDGYFARFEAKADFPDPESTLIALLTMIENLAPEVREIWNACTLREFNIGYDCGDEPWAFSNQISAKNLARITALGGSLGITLYPVCDEETKPETNIEEK